MPSPFQLLEKKQAIQPRNNVVSFAQKLSSRTVTEISVVSLVVKANAGTLLSTHHSTPHATHLRSPCTNVFSHNVHITTSLLSYHRLHLFRDRAILTTVHSSDNLLVLPKQFLLSFPNWPKRLTRVKYGLQPLTIPEYNFNLN